MSDIKTGLWQNTLDGSYIKVRNVLETYVTYSDEGCADIHVMNKREIIGCYKLVEADEPAPVVKKPPYQASLNAWVLVRELEEDNKPEVWKNINDDSCINVSHIGSKYAYWSEDGSSDSHSMDIKYFTENYRLAGVGSKPAPVVDDTFNDDTPAQTFSDIKWDMGTDEKCEAILVTVCSKCGSTVPTDSVDKPALSRWAARFLKAVKGIEVSE